MKIYISADIEGIGGVVRSEHSSTNGREYQWARTMMTREVNAAIRGAFDGGADEVVVADSHNVGLNLLPDALDERARLVKGSPRPLSMMEGVQLGFDAAFLVGYHSMAGTADSTIVHVFTNRIAEVQLNGTTLGEIGLSAALAGHHGVPVALVTGDDKTAAEAKALLGDVETVEVKRGISSYAALCLSPKASCEHIYEGAHKAMTRLDAFQPLATEAPVRLQVRLTTSSSVDRLKDIPGIERLDGRTVAYEGGSVPDVFSVFHLIADLMELVHFI